MKEETNNEFEIHPQKGKNADNLNSDGSSNEKKRIVDWRTISETALSNQGEMICLIKKLICSTK